MSPVISRVSSGQGINSLSGFRRAFLGRSGGAAGDYQISRSLRFNSADSAYLSKSFGSAGSLTTFTIAGWVKRTTFGSYDPILLSADTSQTTEVAFTTNNEIQFADGPVVYRKTNAVFRDPSAWYHVVVVWDSNNATDAHRCRIYVNGVEQSYQTSPSITSGTTTDINTTDIHYINRQSNTYGNCYHADVHFLDGITPGTATDDSNGSVTGIPNAEYLTSFGEFDTTTGVWNPKAYTGSHGTNGFHLKFDNTADLGEDAAGSNDWTVNNISAGGANYSSTLTATSPHPSGNPASYGFDGVPSSSDANTFLAASGADVVWDASSYGFTNVEVEVYVFGVGGSLRQWSVNGGTAVDEATSAGWQNLGTYSTLSEVRCIGISPYGGAFSAIRLNGSIIVDNFDNDNDSLRDSPTNGDTADDTGLGGEVAGNYATLNPLDKVNGTLGNGNLELTGISGYAISRSTIGVKSEKWYFEGIFPNVNGATIGIISQEEIITSGYPNNSKTFQVFRSNEGYWRARIGTTDILANNILSASNGDVLSIALDASAQKVWFAKNGTWYGSGTQNPATNSGGYSYSAETWASDSLHGFLADGAGGAITTYQINFGQRPFNYQAPSGFRPIATPFLSDPTIADGSDYMDVVTYTGNGSTQAITGLGFSPDFVWIKNRAATVSHYLQDIVRGNYAYMNSNGTGTENTSSGADWFSSFDSTGFTVKYGSTGFGNSAGWNENNTAYVAWTWDAGSSTVSNTDGSITSSVRANPTAGFSIVTYTGSAGATIGHGLGVPPQLIIAKSRTSGTDWIVYSSVLGRNGYLVLNGTGSAGTLSNYWGTADPTSTVFGVYSGAGASNNAGNMVAYCFAPVEGYSAFGSYTGNGSADGPFVFTNFRPRWVLIKKVTNADNNCGWHIYDSERDPGNTAFRFQVAESAYAETRASNNTAFVTSYYVDLVSNGFKLRHSSYNLNNSSDTYIYAAFAENPFSLARAR